MDIKKYIREVQDFPKAGISFKDISTILDNPEAFRFVIDWLTKESQGADVIVGPDARGFLFGTPVAYNVGKPFIMVRKPGKLPGKTISEDYELEYGTNTLEMIADSIKAGQKVVVVDDLLATGGTAVAIAKLIEKQGGIVSKMLFVAELTFLPGKEVLKDYHVESLVKY